MSGVADVVTVTPNPGLMPGGDGVSAGAALAAAGFRVAMTGWLGAANAARFEAFFAERGIADHFVRVPGETTPPPAERSLLMERVLGLSAPDRWIVMAGSLPPGIDAGFYCELATLVAGAGGRVLIDTSGEPLRRALRSEPHVLRTNLRDLETVAGRPLNTRADIVPAARGLLKGGTEMVAVSLAGDGAAFVPADRALATATPPMGGDAGDAMVAGIVAGRIRGLGLEETARLASALALAAPAGEPAEGWLERVTLSEIG
jgi:1-phosphofructokinase